MYVFIFLLLFNFLVLSDELIYPVSYIKRDVDNKKSILIYVMHQKSLYDIKLYLWNPETQKFINAFDLPFFPGSLKVLPDYSGFSFIDHGKLIVKYFDNNLVYQLSQPIYNINMVEWINSDTCYFSAKQNNRFSIFQANIVKQKLYCIKSPLNDKCNTNFICPENHYLYPQKIDSLLFYIERISDEKSYRKTKNRYKIVETTYPNIDYDVDQNSNSDLNKKIILDFGSTPIAFLYMSSPEEGFFIEHPNYIDIEKDNQIISFSYYRLKKYNNAWTYEKLFDFDLPMSYFFGDLEHRLYESILAFLPKHNKKHTEQIFYVHCSDYKNLTLDIYSWSPIGPNKKTNNSSGKIFLAPLIVENKVFYGTNLNKLDIKSNFLNIPSFVIS